MFYRVMRWIVYPFIRLFIRVKCVGRENIPKNEAYMLCANHTSIADMFVIAVPFKNQICYMAKEEIFKFSFLKWFFEALGCFAVKRGKGDTGAIDRACSVINEGNVLGIFPEGTRSKTGELGKVRSGAALIAIKTKATILPVSIRYSTKTFKLFCKATIRIGKPISYIEPTEDETQRAEIRRVSEGIMNNIKTLWEMD